MEKGKYLDPNIRTQGEQLVSEQIMESYHSGVIDHDVQSNITRTEREN